MKETKFIAFSTQKGGAGKTTLTVLTASYLHYVKGLSVGVVDCDFPQFSIMDMRKTEQEVVPHQGQPHRGCHCRRKGDGRGLRPRRCVL